MEVKYNGGISLSSLMAVILVVLKILDEIDLSWFWVITSFIWIPLSILALFFLVFFVFLLIAEIASIFK